MKRPVRDPVSGTYTIKNKTYKEQLLFGFYADARGINVQNSNANDYSLEVVGSAGIGFTLTGNLLRLSTTFPSLVAIKGTSKSVLS